MKLFTFVSVEKADECAKNKIEILDAIIYDNVVFVI